MTFTVSKTDLPRAQATLAEAQPQIGFAEVLADPNVAKISVVGVGMRSHAGVANDDVPRACRQGDQHPGHLHQ